MKKIEPKEYSSDSEMIQILVEKINEVIIKVKSIETKLKNIPNIRYY